MTVHTCTMRVEKVCKVREEPAPRLAAERDALGSHCLECLAASASWDGGKFLSGSGGGATAPAAAGSHPGCGAAAAAGCGCRPEKVRSIVGLPLPSGA